MRLTVFGSTPPPAIVEALGTEGLVVETRALPAAGSDEATASVAAALREAESALQAERPQAVLVAGASDEALAALVTAIKLGIPTVALAPGDAHAIASRVADLAVPATQDAAEAARAIRALAAPTLPSP